MKYSLIILVLGFTCFACTNQQHCNLPNLKAKKQDTLAVDTCKGVLREAWEVYNDSFLVNCYEPYFNKQQIHFDCSTCEQVFLTISLKIDAVGHCSAYQLTSEYIWCKQLSETDKVDFKNQVHDYLYSHKFAACFYNKQLILKLHPKAILKC